MRDTFSKIRQQEREGNFNGLILTFVENYDALQVVKPELLKRVAHYLERFRAFISPQTINAIRSLPAPDLQYAGLADVLEASSGETPGQSVGRIVFPVVTSVGLVREIRVTKKDGGDLSPARLQVLDRTGSAVFRVLGRRMGRLCFWRPERYAFGVLDPYGKDDPGVEGDSMSLALALALYSHVTDVPVPPDLSATAAVSRDGSLSPVSAVREKLDTLSRERFHIKRVLVSAAREMPDYISGIEVIKALSLEQALSIAFPDSPDTTCFSGDMDLSAEIRSLNARYDSYLIDTCIENAGDLIRYLESRPPNVSQDRLVPALFTCYWKKGSCHCHRGDVRKTDAALKKAISLHDRYPGLIRADHYLDAGISYGVLLKDIFRYEEAEAVHLGLIDEMQKSRSLDHVKGKNLSTLSQLYLATGRFGEAEEYQRRAMPLIRKEELCRNYGYLAQIHTRKGDFRKAASALSHYHRLIRKSDRRTQAAHTPFYHWMRAEYLYRRGLDVRKARPALFRELHYDAEKYGELGWWVPALIHKFAGLALLVEGSETRGFDELDKVVRYFSSQFEPVLRVLGASVRAERAQYFLRTERPEEALADIVGIIEDLSLQKDIRRFFRPTLSALSRFLRCGRYTEATAGKVLDVLQDVENRIPY
jgi:tetratricopeptide (TPR) repeat protein